MIYCRAKFTRGSGLGTRLWPWARCRIFSFINDAPMLYPQWVQPRIGPLIRGGIHYGSYNSQILLWRLFKQSAREIGGWKRLLLQTTANVVSEEDELNTSDDPTSKDVIVEFAGDRGKFRILRDWDRFLYQEIRAITRPRWLELVEAVGEVPIGINVRLGNDFKQAQAPEDYFNKGAIKTPLSWFVESLAAVRQELGYCARAYVVSDGTAKELDGLLKQENVAFVRPGCAISDLLVLSRANILIASGGSSFSAWASFLGQMPTISHPGQSMTWFEIENKKQNYVGEFDPHSPAPAFLNNLKRLRTPGNTFVSPLTESSSAGIRPSVAAKAF